MKSHFIIILTLLLSQIQLPILALSENEIKQKIIKQSIADYKKNTGNCPCPESLDKAGRRCGKRSAWSKLGGKSPICYPGDVTKKMIKEYKKKN